jgi:hypothetical protein
MELITRGAARKGRLFFEQRSQFTLGQQHWLDQHRSQSDLKKSGIVGPTHWQRTCAFKAVRQWLVGSGPVPGTKPLGKRNATAQAVGENLGGFCVTRPSVISQLFWGDLMRT